MNLSAPIFALKRRAKLLARSAGIALHEAQDRIARQEGFRRWSHLAAHHTAAPTASTLLDQLGPGRLVLLAGQREHGKTTLAFELMARAIGQGRAAAYFSLEETDATVVRRLAAAGVGPADAGRAFSFDTSDHITADTIAGHLPDPAPGTLIVVDYLQILDQQRDKPPLAEQVDTLRRFVDRTQATVVLLAQIDRSFDAEALSMPGIEHIRLPNPVDLTRFDRACFIHDGRIRLASPA